MSVKLYEIASALECLAPLQYAEPWDNVGLLLGDANADITKMLIALDVTDEVVAEAIEKKVDCILSHHPLLLGKINRVVADNPLTKRMIHLIQNHIHVYALHTNLDIAPMGVNDTLANRLSLKQIEPLCDYVDADKRYALGRVGVLEQAQSLQAFAETVKQTLSMAHVTYVGDSQKSIRKVAVLGGSGADTEYFDYAKKRGADILLTSDVKYHKAQAALEMDLVLIDATHYATEVIVLPVLQQYLQSKFAGLEIVQSGVDGQVIQYI